MRLLSQRKRRPWQRLNDDEQPEAKEESTDDDDLSFVGAGSHPVGAMMIAGLCAQKGYDFRRRCSDSRDDDDDVRREAAVIGAPASRDGGISFRGGETSDSSTGVGSSVGIMGGPRYGHRPVRSKGVATEGGMMLHPHPLPPTPPVPKPEFQSKYVEFKRIFNSNGNTMCAVSRHSSNLSDDDDGSSTDSSSSSSGAWPRDEMGVGRGAINGPIAEEDPDTTESDQTNGGEGGSYFLLHDAASFGAGSKSSGGGGSRGPLTPRRQGSSSSLPGIQEHRPAPKSSNHRRSAADSILSLPIGMRHDTKVVCTEFSPDPYDSLRIASSPGRPFPVHLSDVVVAVEACTVSTLDCLLRSGDEAAARVLGGGCSGGGGGCGGRTAAGGAFASDSRRYLGGTAFSVPFCVGCDFVGRVLDCGDDASSLHGIRVGDRVASLCRGAGGNARYLTAHAETLVCVPDGLDAADAVCGVLGYATAFGALQHGIGRPGRYGSGTLAGRRVLVTAGATYVGGAVIDLALIGGAFRVYATGPVDHHDYLLSLGTTPLEEDPEEWLPVVRGRMDCVVYMYCDGRDDYEALRSALRPNGRLICLGNPPSIYCESQGSAWLAPMQSLYTQAMLSLTLRASYYDVFYSFDNYLEEFKSDLSHIFDLMSEGKIRARITKLIALKEVPSAHLMLQHGLVQGAIVCEPWKKLEQYQGYMPYQSEHNYVPLPS